LTPEVRNAAGTAIGVVTGSPRPCGLTS